MGSIYQERLNPDEIQSKLHTTFLGQHIICLDTVDSTNQEARRRAETEEDGTIILSEEQTGGRGRQGRVWISPGGKGIWMSFILKPKITPEKVPQLTLIAASAICLALEGEQISGLQVKWPNDILIDGRKLSGILTEMQSRGNKVEYVVLGIGVNVSLGQEDFPDELQNQASSLYLETGRMWDRASLITAIINNFEPLYREYIEHDKLEKVLDICRQRSAVLGKNILLYDKGSVRSAEALDLGPQGELLVRMDDGQQTAIVSGEISIRISDGI